MQNRIHPSVDDLFPLPCKQKQIYMYLFVYFAALVIVPLSFSWLAAVLGLWHALYISINVFIKLRMHKYPG